MPDSSADLRSILLGPSSDEVISLLRDINIAQIGHASLKRTPAIDDAWQTILQAGLIDESGHLTPRGWRVGDSCREYLWWEERGRTAHEWGIMPIMSREHFEDRDVLSVGEGAGFNLLSVYDFARSTVGVDIEPIYLEMSEILSERAGLPKPDLRLAPAENLPFHRSSFDMVLCIAVLQLTDIRSTLGEIARVLRPGGYAVLIQSDFRGHLLRLRTEFREFMKPKRLVRESQILIGNLLYPRLGRALMRAHDPVYLPHATLVHWMDELGMTLDADNTRVFGTEVCYVVRKRPFSVSLDADAYREASGMPPVSPTAER